MGLFSKRGSLNLKGEASNRVQDQIDPNFEKPDNHLDTWAYTVEDEDTLETELSLGNSHRVVQDGDDDPPGWSGMQASMDDAGSMNFIPGIATDQKGAITDFEDGSKGCCAQCRYSCRIAFRPCTTKHNPLPHNPSRWRRFKFAFLCPPHGTVGRTVTYLILVLLLWAVLFTITGAEALPGGNLFGIYVLVITSIVLGLLVNKILRLPALLGKLTSLWYASSAIGPVSFLVIPRAGLGINAKALEFRVPQALLLHRLSWRQRSFPWEWAFMLGFVLAAVSPAVVVPCLLVLQKGGYGSRKGIPTLTIASCSLDNVLCISAFGVAMGISFSSGSLILKIFQGPFRGCYRCLFGVFAGVPGSFQAKTWITAKKCSLAYDEGEQKYLIHVAVGNLIGAVWWLFEPILFGLIGAEVAIEYLDGQTVGLGIATLILGLVIRIAATWLSVLGADFNKREKLFMIFTWFPKATVQAALGPLALDEVMKQGIVDETDEANQLRGIQLLTIAVLSILITAPIGAILVTLCGPKLLEKETRPSTVSHPSGELGAVPGDEREELGARQRLTAEEHY
nr:sodium/hydrogen exchanger 9B2-like [Lytechinus pictus]